MPALSTNDVAGEFGHARVVWKSPPGDFEFGQGPIIIEVSAVKIFSTCKVSFACVRTQTKCRLDRCLGLGQPRWGMIVPEEVDCHGHRPTGNKPQKMMGRVRSPDSRVGPLGNRAAG